MLLLILIGFVSTANSFEYFKRCLLYQGRCVTHCPRTMHPYHTRCDRDTMSQRTCDNVHIYSLGYTCGWSRCDCNGDLLLDELTGHCLTSENCPTTSHKDRKRGERKLTSKDRPKMKNKIRFSESEMPDMD